MKKFANMTRVSKGITQLDSVISLIGLTVLWGLLVWRGFPFPHPDDQAFVGAALNLAQGGGLVNALLEQHTSYSAYPPVYSYCLALWLKIFGISSAAVVAYSFTLSWLTTWNVLSIYAARGRLLAGWLVILVLVVFVAAMGIRSDLTGLFFLSCSLRLGLSQVRRWQLLSPFFAMLAVATHPALLSVSIPWLLWMLMSQPDWKWWLANLLGGLAVVLLLILMLRDGLMPFINGFLHHSGSARESTTAGMIANFWKPQFFAKLVILPALCGLAIGVKIIKRGWDKRDCLVFIALLLALYTCFNSITGQRMICLLSVAALCDYLERIISQRWLIRSLSVASGILAIVTLARPLLQGATTTQPLALGKQLREEVLQIQATRIIIDQWSLRYVFDFQPGPNAVSISAARNGAGRADGPKINPDECWVMSAECVRYYDLSHPGFAKPRPKFFLGHELGQWLDNPGEMTVLKPSQKDEGDVK